MASQFSRQLNKLKEINYTSYITTLVAFTQGMVGLGQLALSYLLKDDLKVPPAQFTFYFSIVQIPWIVKPLWGFISDGYPIFGYRRKSYLVLFSCVHCMIWITLAFLPNITPIQVVLLLLTKATCMSFCNVIGEALMVQIAQKNQEKQDGENDKTASNNVSLFFGAKSIGYLITAYLSGILLEKIDKKAVLLLTSLFPLILFISSIFLKEQSTKNNPETENISKMENIKKLINFTKRKEIYKPIIVIWIFLAAPTSGSVMFYFLTNKLNFTKEFMGRLRVASSLASVIGIALYNKYFSNVEFKKILCWTTILYVVMSLSQIILITRTNLVLGIPDGMFCFSDSLISQVIGEINLLPLLVLACQMCPKNIEGTMYALIMSIINFGGMISEQLGGLLTLLLNLNSNNFDNLSYLILITSVSWLFPLILVLKTDFEKPKVIAEILPEYTSEIEIPYYLSTDTDTPTSSTTIDTNDNNHPIKSKSNQNQLTQEFFEKT